MLTRNIPQIVIISPALAKANNGNWQTARRWARFLRQHYRVRIAAEWDGRQIDAMVALHARRSAASIAAFAAAQPDSPLVVVLTGTDLYRDIRTDADAQRSLQLATQLVLLQASGLQELAADLRAKSQVIHQSTPPLKAVAPATPAARRQLQITMIGHLREEKDPATFMRAAALVQAPQARLIHIGGALEPGLGRLAEQTGQQESRYRWLGSLPHAIVRQRLKRSHLMVISSRMEGGANVIIEAISSGVPILASDISGNRGMLGDDYAGYFPLGDSRQLARLIDRSITDPSFYALLQWQCAARAPLFAPEREKTALLQLMDNLMATAKMPPQ
ncbi:MAG: selenoneine biosynthesis selenosugar synthase SenB [Oxalobacteraceae bacterium]|nr:selenoneine biosynthesis selenosugar synthase SenB [Oxalobacteraceae bacterium]